MEYFYNIYYFFLKNCFLIKKNFVANVVYTNTISSFTDNSYFTEFSLFNAPEFFTVLFIFNFLQLLILTSISELIWPTQLFNRQNTIGFTAYRLRTYTEYLLKLRKNTVLYKVFFKYLLK